MALAVTLKKGGGVTLILANGEFIHIKAEYVPKNGRIRTIIDAPRTVGIFRDEILPPELREKYGLNKDDGTGRPAGILPVGEADAGGAEQFLDGL